MKKYIKFLTITCCLVLFTACLVENDDPIYELNDQGPNLLGFARASFNASVVTDGTETQFILPPVQLAGPTASSYTGEFTADIEIDPASTAVEGVHFMLPSNTVTISSVNNLIATIPLIVLTDGVEAPSAPKLILNLTNSSDGTVVPNGRTASLTINIEYLCYSDISGKYRALEAKYFRLGVESSLSNPESWPAETEIIYLCGTTFRVLEYFGPEAFNGNEWYFDVNETTGVITYPATTPDGSPQIGNDQPFISCQTNPGDFTSVGISCGTDSNRVEFVGNTVKLYMSFGYNTTGSGPRVFYHVLEKIVE